MRMPPWRARPYEPWLARRTVRSTKLSASPATSATTRTPRPLRADPGAAREAGPTVDDEGAAVVAMVDAAHVERVERSEGDDVAARAQHQVPGVARHLVRAHGVDEHVDADAGPAPVNA